MKAKILIVSVITILLAACNKDKFTTKPQLEFESFNSDVVQPGSRLVITLKYTDKEGDIQDSIYVVRDVANCLNDSIRRWYPIPGDVPEIRNSEGQIEITYSHLPDATFPLIGEPSCGENDTCIYRFALSDKAGNISDTISTPPVVIIKR